MATYQSKTWVDMQSEYPTRYKIRHSDLSEEQVTMFADFGTVTESGDVFDAQTMNNLESRIGALASSVEEVTAGTTDPSGGKNGDIYFKTGVDGNNDPVILGMYVKINGSWMVVSTGGASLPQAEGSGF